MFIWDRPLIFSQKTTFLTRYGALGSSDKPQKNLGATHYYLTPCHASLYLQAVAHGIVCQAELKIV